MFIARERKFKNILTSFFVTNIPVEVYQSDEILHAFLRKHVVKKSGLMEIYAQFQFCFLTSFQFCKLNMSRYTSLIVIVDIFSFEQEKKLSFQTCVE